MRGPALLKLGFEPSNKGLQAWMDSRYSGDDYSDLNDADFKELTDAHNRIVALMGGNDPANIPDALAARRSGVGLSMGSAFEAEPEPEAPAEAPAAEAPAAEAPAAEGEAAAAAEVS